MNLDLRMVLKDEVGQIILESYCDQYGKTCFNKISQLHRINPDMELHEMRFFWIVESKHLVLQFHEYLIACEQIVFIIEQIIRSRVIKDRVLDLDMSLPRFLDDFVHDLTTQNLKQIKLIQIPKKVVTLKITLLYQK